MLDPIALPRQLQSLAGRITDTDSHEMIPAQLWESFFGSEVKELADALMNTGITDIHDRNSSNIPDYPGDVVKIDESIVDIKGCRAPGAADIARRIDVMESMGVKRQLMYPTSVGIWAILLLMSEADPLFLRSIGGDRAAKARSWIKVYNRWMMDEAGRSDRIRPVPPLVGENLDELLQAAGALINAGIRAIWFPSSLPPAGRSPAHPDLDALWEMLAEANCVVALHVGTEGKHFEPLQVWRDAPAFEGYRSLGEFSTDPWYLSNVHLPAQNFLTTMVLGGVFIRHPALRVAVSEVGAHWVGPMMEAMDIWHRNLTAFSPHSQRLTQLPSSFVKSNIRVSPFSFEDVAVYLDRYDIGGVVCFSSDYPHVEGGKSAMKAFYQNLERHGPKIVEKFFVTNGEFVLPA